MTMPMTEEDEREFYELCQNYRHCPRTDQAQTIVYFNELRAFVDGLREKARKNENEYCAELCEDTARNSHEHAFRHCARGLADKIRLELDERIENERKQPADL